MSKWNRNAQWESFAAVKETCPAVDAAFERACAAVKEQTGNLREALTEALDRALTAEERVEDLEREVAELRRLVEDQE